MSDNVKITVKINQNKLEALKKKYIEALFKTADLLVTEIVNAQVLPFDQGTLQSSMSVDDSQKNKGKVSITISVPYARRLYYHPEFHFQKLNANAGGLWFENYLTGSKSDFVKITFTKLLK